MTWLDWRWVFLLIPALAIPAALLLRPALNRADGGTGVVPIGSSRRVGWALTAAGCAGTFQFADQRDDIVGILLMGASLAGLLVAVPGSYRRARSARGGASRPLSRCAV